MKNKLKLSEEWIIVENANSEDKPEAFRVLCKNLLQKFKLGELTINELGYNICSAIRIKELAQAEEFEELISMGCNIELPLHHQDGDPIKNQAEFLSALESLDS